MNYTQSRTISMLVALMLATVSEVFSQTLRSVDSRNGLSSMFVLSLYQDVRGFVWAGTYSGLSILDGNGSTVAFSLSHFDELEWNQRLHYERLHWADLTHYGQTFAHFDLWQRGIGNNSCFSDSCLPKYETPYPGNNQGLDSLTYTLRFIPEAK